jgi:hypothetical protein
VTATWCRIRLQGTCSAVISCIVRGGKGHHR